MRTRLPERDPRALPIGVAGCSAVLFGLLLLDDAFVERWVHSEDGIVENVGAAAFFGAALLVGMLFRRERRIGDLLLGLGFLAAAGEELAWGQHALNFKTPEAAKDVNAQDDFTVHNLDVVTDVADFDVLLVAFLGFVVVYAAVLPLLARRSGRVRHVVGSRLSIASTAFIAPLALTLALFGVAASLSSDERTHAVTETAETGLALLILAMAADALRRKSPDRERSRDPLAGGPETRYGLRESEPPRRR